MNNIRNIAIFLLFAMMGFYACEEGERFGISSDDKIPPDAPVLDSVIPLYGGARIVYTIPDTKANEDLLSIEAAFTATNGKVVKSAVSFFASSLEIYGFGDTLEHTLDLYALDRAGNKSAVVPVKVKPLEPTYSRVARSLKVYPAFSAFMVAWKNELMQDVNVFVDFNYSDKGTPRSLRQVYSSRDTAERKVISGLNLPESEPVSVQVTVEDLYGNRMLRSDITPLHLMTQEKLDKSKWVFPVGGTIIGGTPMSSGDNNEGRMKCLTDGFIDDMLHPVNYAFFNNLVIPGHGYYLPPPTNNIAIPDGVLANVMIDLGAKYELSSIVTHQRRTVSAAGPYDNAVGNYYGAYNINKYEMYYWDGNDDGTVNNATEGWKLINTVNIPVPVGLRPLEIIQQADQGDAFMMYPEEPKFTPATRWFTYRALSEYSGTNYRACLAELTLYGKKAN
jgi:hypothetical protein